MNKVSRRRFLRIGGASVIGLTAFTEAETLQPQEESISSSVPLDAHEQSLLVPLNQPVASPAAARSPAAPAPAPRSPTTPPPPPPGSEFRRQGRRVVPVVDNDRPQARSYTPAKGMTPEIESRVWAAFQRVIMFAEGTWYRGSPHNGYLIMYTGKNIRDILPNFQYEKHPYFLVPANRRSSVIPCGLIKGRRVCSWASGIGQFMPDTWTEFWHKYPKVWFQSIPEFGAQNQDRMIQILAGECGAYWALMRGVAIAAGKAEVNRDNLRTAIVKASPTWAGLPNWLDESALDQNAKPMAELERLFYRELNDLQRAV